jgi:hypothetical protein
LLVADPRLPQTALSGSGHPAGARAS